MKLELLAWQIHISLSCRLNRGRRAFCKPSNKWFSSPLPHCLLDSALRGVQAWIQRRMALCHRSVDQVLHQCSKPTISLALRGITFITACSLNQRTCWPWWLFISYFCFLVCYFVLVILYFSCCGSYFILMMILIFWHLFFSSIFLTGFS